MFAKGDMVRVKAGSPRYCSPGSAMGPYETDYGKGFVVKGVRGYNNVVCCILSGINAINAEYLEPWNDNEEWNGYQWVAKSTGVDETKEAHERNMRDEWEPRVGDAVRVKAGTPPYADREDCSGIGCPNESQFGHKMIYTNGLNILAEHLEPWNDDEEWDGKKWVTKPLREHGLKVGDSVDVIDGNLKGGKSVIEKIDDSGDGAILRGWNWWIPIAFLRKRDPIESAEPLVPDEVIISGVRYVRAKNPVENIWIPKKTNAEIAEELFKARMSHGRVQYSSDNMQAGVRITHVRRTGNIVTVDFDAGE